MILTLLVLPTVIIASREAIRPCRTRFARRLRPGASKMAVVVTPPVRSAPSRHRDRVDSRFRADRRRPADPVGAFTYISFDPTLWALHSASDPDLLRGQLCLRRSTQPRCCGQRDHRPAWDPPDDECVPRDLAAEPLPAEMVSSEMDGTEAPAKLVDVQPVALTERARELRRRSGARSSSTSTIFVSPTEATLRSRA